MVCITALHTRESYYTQTHHSEFFCIFHSFGKCLIKLLFACGFCHFLLFIRFSFDFFLLLSFWFNAVAVWRKRKLLVTSAITWFMHKTLASSGWWWFYLYISSWENIYSCQRGRKWYNDKLKHGYSTRNIEVKSGRATNHGN